MVTYSFFFLNIWWFLFLKSQFSFDKFSSPFFCRQVAKIRHKKTLLTTISQMQVLFWNYTCLNVIIIPILLKNCMQDRLGKIEI
jgi:hypothetical protein